MTVPSDQEEVVRKWIEKAEHDLITAQHTLTLTENCPFDTICFHAQQATEKYLKALLVFYHIDFPKVHDVGDLVALLPVQSRALFSLDDLAELSPYAVEKSLPQ